MDRRSLTLDGPLSHHGDVPTGRMPACSYCGISQLAFALQLAPL
jgi:hypothetical protein